MKFATCKNLISLLHNATRKSEGVASHFYFRRDLTVYVNATAIFPHGTVLAMEGYMKNTLLLAGVLALAATGCNQSNTATNSGTNTTAQEVQQGASNAWQTTKSAASNAWDATKSGATNVWNKTTNAVR